jgi:hypothetical protein
VGDIVQKLVGTEKKEDSNKASEKTPTVNFFKKPKGRKGKRIVKSKNKKK